MSYNFSATGPKSTVLDSVWDDAAEQAVGVQEDAVQPAVRDHVAALHSAAAVLLDTVGASPDDVVTISVYGHANPGHGARDGYASETATVQVLVNTHVADADREPEPAAGS